MAATRALEFYLEVGILTAVLGDSKIIINSLKEDNEFLAPYRVQGSQSRIGGCTSLTSRTIYFGTGQYWCTISSLPLFFIYINIYIYIYIYYNKYKSLP